MRIALLIIYWLIPTITDAAITIDAVSSAESAVPGTSTSHTHTLGASADWIGVCVSSRDTGSAIQPVTSVTVGGNAASLVARVQNSANALSAELWQLVSPPTGSQVVAVVNDAVNDRTVTTVLSLNGVATSSTLGTPVTASDGGADEINVDVNSIGSAGGELGVLCGAGRTNTITASADATAPVSTEEIERAHADGTSNIGFLYTEAGAATSIDMRVDLSAAARWAAVGVSIRPSLSFRKRPMVLYP